MAKRVKKETGITNISPKEQKAYVDIYYLDEDKQFIKIKEGVVITYINNLKIAIEDASDTINIMNVINQQLIGTAKELVGKMEKPEDIINLTNMVNAIVTNLNTLFGLAKSTPERIEILTSLEKKILQEQREIRELFGGKVKGFKEDSEDYVISTEEPEVKTKSEW